MVMTSTLLYFLGASVALTIAPGPDNIFVLTQGISRGRKPAIVTALGMCSGLSIHTTAAAFGISAVFYSSLVAFNAVKFAGAAYLIYLAYKALKERSSINLSDSDDRSDFALFKRGFVLNILNPKVAMFFLAFLPQFVSPTVIIFCLIGYFSGSIGTFIMARPKIAKYFDWLTAGVFASLGVRLALAER
jgi:threonine/homoserine/homoserine lactone efflux protein